MGLVALAALAAYVVSDVAEAGAQLSGERKLPSACRSTKPLTNHKPEETSSSNLDVNPRGSGISLQGKFRANIQDQLASIAGYLG